ncbi:peptidase m75, imelysin [Fulvivirga ulvae]|uniref:imelysin family protein n=1 Tax=Fulvivirga ulvae TaxID=2904245 RepID=UPI001F2DC2EB|nr:imelysin family protein [Fulvivirga ulvae]UII31774.1 peptidase m75, imelysin [Fulvivirga ulvae]
MKSKLLMVALAATVFFSCGDDDESPSVSSTDKQDVVDNYANIVYATYSDALSTAEDLSTAIDALVADPTEINLEAAKTAWLEAREPYGQSEVFRFYGGPIDDEDGPEGQLNAWPLDEAYIDYVNGGGTSSIIQDAANFPTINKELIASQNEAGSETNISSGYHAIEFLLWGQDLSDGPGGGERPATDYDVDNCTGDNCERRGTYLKAAVDLLIDDLEYLVSEWAPNGAYRATFTASANLDSSLEGMLAGMGKLSKGELAGERMFVAYDEKSKEDEHSCFSDNTHRDIVTNAQGIKNVYFGSYTRVDGTVVSGAGINTLVAILNTSLNSELETLLNSSVDATEDIQAPFDQEFLNDAGRARIETAIDLLRQQGDKVAEVSALFGFTLDPSDI